MLEKNNQKVDFKKEKKVSDIIGNKTIVTFQLVNSLSKLDPKTGKRRYKRRHGIEASYVSEDTFGNTTEFRYYKTKNQKGKNGVDETKYTPEYMYFEQHGKINVSLGKDQNENLDLFYFFLSHPRLASNKDGQGSKRPLFFMVNENADAMEYAQKKRASAEMEKYLWHETDRMKDEDLIIIAKALRIPDVGDMTIDRVQVEIDKLCKNNPSRFLALKALDKETEMRAVIQDAVEKGVLKTNLKNEWEMSDGVASAVLCTIRKTDDKTTTLVHFLKHNDDNDHYGRIKELVMDAKKPKVKG